MEDAIRFLEDELLELDGISNIRNKDWNHYYHNDNGVPRVTNILEQCENQRGLIDWASRVGYKKYIEFRDRALSIGTSVHEAIDTYLENKYNGKDLKFDMPFNYEQEIKRCLDNFKLWEKRLNEFGAQIEEVVGIEIPVSCPWYGGTIDGIVKINGRYYIIDFKTSKKISTSYLLQTSAYMWIINNGYAPGLPHIDGVGIIRVDKKMYGAIDDVFVNDFTPEGHYMITMYQNTFASYVNAYYRTNSSEYIYSNYKNKEYVPKEIYLQEK